jgi:hypothetical protein
MIKVVILAIKDHGTVGSLNTDQLGRQLSCSHVLCGKFYNYIVQTGSRGQTEGFSICF